jgi:hypothetical protein
METDRMPPAIEPQGTTRLSHWPAILLLLGGAGLASGVPLVLGHTSSRLNTVTLRDPDLAIWQLIPYVLCGALWLPWRGTFARRAGRGVAGLLFVASAAIYLPMLVHPEWLSGDMVGLAFILVTVAVGAGVLIVTLGIWVVRTWRLRATLFHRSADAEAPRG